MAERPLVRINEINESVVSFDLNGTVIYKSDLNTQKDGGEYFYIHIVDETGKINMVFFKETSPTYFTQITRGNQYRFQNLCAKRSSQTYANFHEYEIIASPCIVINKI
jgi:DNA polymerase III alpha subunit